MSRKVHKKLGDLLLECGYISNEQLMSALSLQKQTKKRLGEVLILEGFITNEDIMKVLETQLGVSHVALDKYDIDANAVLLIPENIARRYQLIPIKREKGELTVAMSDPLNVFAIDDVSMYSNLKVKPAFSSGEDINVAIDKYFGHQKALKVVEEIKREKGIGTRFNSKDTSETEDTSNSEVNNAPTVKLVNLIIEQAVRERASDIHIEPLAKAVKIRFRIDGELIETMKIELDMIKAVNARIKVMSGMNIAEKRMPQDGRISTTVDDNEYDLRVSSLPTVFGEKIVIRVVDKAAYVISKEKLGMFPDEVDSFNKILMNPNGIILVTGPTGSGKSTTLSCGLNELNKPNINIITVEDPVECLIEGVNHVQVNNKTGLNFATGLRSILRQDPDVIMLGEIRDKETAEIAIRAAVTGHLVLSTMHTNDSASSVIRLVEMGIEPFMISSAMVGVIAQRLVKVICKDCKTEKNASKEELEILGMEDERVKLFFGAGCTVCNNTGYKGRKGVYEIMTVTAKHRKVISRRGSEDELKKISADNKMLTLKDNARRLVLKGIISIDEMIRIAYSND